MESKSTGERIRNEVKDDTFVSHVTFEDGTITLDSGAGVNVWPKHVEVPGKNLHKKQGLKMCAANGTEIANFGRKVISFTGKSDDASLGFSRRRLSEWEPAGFRCRSSRCKSRVGCGS